MSDLSLQNRLYKGIVMMLIASCSLAGDPIAYTVGKKEIVATKKQRDALGLKWFIDGNLGVTIRGDRVQFYGANGQRPVRTTGTPEEPLQKVEPVTISTDNKHFKYLSGGPIYRDPQSKRTFLFYHAEIHRGTAKNFYSVIGLSVQTDEHGLAFDDLGPIFRANVSNEKADQTVEICGAPFVMNDGYFYLYARDVLLQGEVRQSNLSVARAKVVEVVQAGLEGRSAKWMKYYDKTFKEAGIGGKSTPLEKDNPGTRWMDVSYNTILKKYIMVVAANTSRSNVELFMTCSDDGIIWSERRKLADENGESFYPSIVGFEETPRETGAEFYIYYTSSQNGGWNRWADAVFVRRRITVKKDRHNKPLVRTP